MQLQKKNIANDAVGAAKIRLENNQYLKARNAADSADVSIAKVNGSNQIELASVPKINGTPSADSDAATVGYVKLLAAGLRDPKDACRVASTADVALTGGATLTIDGVSLANGNRVLLKNQANAEENGIYDVSGIGDAYVLTRSADADEDAEVTQGMSTWVLLGDENARTGWMLSTADPIDVGVTELTFVQVPISDAPVFEELKKTLSATDITNQYFDLAHLALPGSLKLSFGGLQQTFGDDYDLSEVGGVTRVTFDGDLATGGASELVENDVLVLNYAR